ncbi:TPA: hypothetical protein ACPYV4_000894 [Klebsiella pneumoniae]
MNNSAIPSRLTVVFSVNGEKNTIPTNSTSDTLAEGNAAMDSGFPPLTRVALSAGGKPPKGQDFNGIFNDVYTRLQWSAAGMGYPFNNDFRTAIAGYPKGAIIPASNFSVTWLNTIDANNSAPEKTDATSSGWIPSWGCGAATVSISTADVNVSHLQAANPRIILTGALTGNRVLYLPPWIKDWTIENNCTGSAYYVQISTKAAGKTVNSKPGTTTKIHSDGTNITNDDGFLRIDNNLSEIADAGNAAKSSARSNLGLGTSAVRDIGTQGDTIPLLSGANIWSSTQYMVGSGTPDLGEVRSATGLYYPYGLYGTMWGEVYSVDIVNDHFESRIVVVKDGKRKYFRFKENGEFTSEGDIKAGGGVYDQGNRVYSASNKQPPEYINEVGAYAWAWYDGAANYNDTVSGTLLFPATGDGNHASTALNGTWRCMGKTETVNDQHRTTLWQKISN